MFETVLNEVPREQQRSSANLLAESICSVGYDLARIYCARMEGQELLERRCNLGSDEDFVYCARWYSGGEDVPGMRTDMIFYRETDDAFRLHIVSRPETEAPESINLSEGALVDGRRPLAVWRKLIDEILPRSDNVLDPPTGFENKRESINLHFPEGSWKSHSRVARTELSLWDGARQLDAGKIETLREGGAVALFPLLGRHCRVQDVRQVVDFYREQIERVLEPEFCRIYTDVRKNELDAGNLGRAMLHRRRHEYLNGVSWHQVRILAEEAQRLSTELKQVESSLTFIQRYLYRLPLVNVSVSGATAARLVLCFNSFDSDLFRAGIGSTESSLSGAQEVIGKGGRSAQYASGLAAYLRRAYTPRVGKPPLIPVI